MNQPVPDCHFCHQEYYPGVEKECASKPCGFSQAKTMKPAGDWVDENSSSGAFDQVRSIIDAIRLVKEIQRNAIDAAGPPLAFRQEVELAQNLAANERIRADQLHDQLIKMRERWLEARRYLRAANKGAERNAQALELAARRLANINDITREMTRRDQHKHETIVWNWLLLSDEQFRLKFGDPITVEHIYAFRILLKAMLGTRILKL